MSQLAIGYKTLVDSGKERRSDGLLKHLGQLDTSSLRVCGVGGHPSLTGAGVETIYQAQVQTGTIQCFDRDAQVYRDLNIAARNITLQPQSGGKVTLPAGTAQSLVASYVAPTGASYATAPWAETVIQCSGTFTGVPVRVELVCTWANVTAGQTNYFALGVDGSAMLGLATIQNTSANFLTTTSLVWYQTPAAGVHRYALFVGVGGGQLNFHNGTYAVLYCTEQRA